MTAPGEIPLQPLTFTDVIGTPCLNTSAAELLELLERECRAVPSKTLAVDFTNVHIATARRIDPGFRKVTDQFDYFVPDSQVLKWTVNLLGGSMRSRVYGPDFLRFAAEESASDTTHFFLGGSPECQEKLIANLRRSRPTLRIVGSRHGYFTVGEEEEILETIRGANPDFIWIGLGTPKQQDWVHRNRDRLERGVLLAVGFAFDVNAGLKHDAPRWMHPWGLTWLYRLLSEPRRLWRRYLKYNSLFLYFLAGQFLKRARG